MTGHSAYIGGFRGSLRNTVTRPAQTRVRPSDLWKRRGEALRGCVTAGPASTQPPSRSLAFAPKLRPCHGRSMADGDAVESFDFGTARRTLRQLQFAHDRWREVYAHLEDLRFEGENNREEVALRVRSPAVETITSVRALDDWCLGLLDNKGRPTQPVLAGYEERRAEVEGLLNGARYATNRSLHQLLVPTTAYGLMRFPFNPNHIFNTFAGVRWLAERHLPPALSENPRQQELRKDYVKHMARQDVGPTLDRLREFFEAVLATDDM
jgi:hypothetical protein